MQTMREEDEIAVNRLIDLKFWEPHARKLVRRNGRCVYCGADVLHDRLGYATLQWDHLLPKAHYRELKHDPNNIVLACQLCNSLKWDYDPSNGTGTADMLQNDKFRSQWIEQARLHISKERQKDTADVLWRKVRKIILGLDSWPDELS